jgi:hypothetical protein
MICMKQNSLLALYMFIPIVVLLSMQGCSTMADNRRWGEDVTLRPGSDTISGSLINAVSSPYVLIPGAGALVLQIRGMDKRLSRWAVKRTPTAGSTGRAGSLSDNLLSVSRASFFVSALMTPSGDDPENWIVSKAKGMAVQGTALGISDGSTYLLKKASGRTRPNRASNMSFPSGHASSSAVFTSLAVDNVRLMNIPPAAKTSLDVMLHAVMFGVAWERVEAGVHYPSDVLAGIALGCFIGPFINDSFMGIGQGQGYKTVMGPTPDGFFVGIQKRF